MEHLLILTMDADAIPLFGLLFYCSSAADAAITEASSAMVPTADVDADATASLSSCYFFSAVAVTALAAVDANYSN